MLPGRRPSLPKAAAVSTDLADLLWERQERNSITDKKDVQSAHTHKISEKKNILCILPEHRGVPKYDKTFLFQHVCNRFMLDRKQRLCL